MFLDNPKRHCCGLCCSRILCFFTGQRV
ncbi:hypothetical protein Goari_001000 [Gossypium aridum]|uniref:Uncharacterized protein n=1 Tax=Gossypium aridum TaxID=34290 RepID=A0A7J8YK02_GOSAI|nr:hypothetical protein [Gossypium aridum]